MRERQTDLARIASWAGIELPDEAQAQLTGFEDWIVGEAIPAGGVGPNEHENLWERHILDSALFAGFVEDHDRVLDVGSGVGLPGIPIAVLRPNCQVTLLDRAGRRCALARRAVRVLALDNVRVVQGEVPGYSGTHSLAISRASLPPQQLLTAVRGIEGLRAVVAAGSRARAPTVPEGWESVEIPTDVVGDRVWLLRTWISSDEAD